MAELVQLHLENMLPELEQMERTGLFTTKEIKDVVKRRKALEYSLRRRKKSKEDYLKYIEYEKKVLKMIALRRKRLRINSKRKEIDHAVAVRINKLFKAAITRYQNEEELWLKQIEFCIGMKWFHTISALFARMLQAHSNKPELWVMAAKWEFEENNAPENARKLLQRSLRFHSKSKYLWTEYFRMELMYTDLVRKRREVLGLQEAQDSDSDAVLTGKIASVVYKKATKAISDPDFALSLIELCRLFDFTADHIEQIFEDIQHRHPLSEVALDAIAKRPLLTLQEELETAKEKGIKKKTIISETEQKVCASYEDAVELVKSEKMWTCYIEFAMGRWKSAEKEKKKVKLLNCVLSLMERASSADLLSSDLYSEWCKLLQIKGDEDSSCSVALQIAQKWPKNVSSWVQCLEVHISARKEDKVISSICTKAIASLSAEKSLPIWKLGIQWLLWSNPSALKDYFEKAIIQTRHVELKEIYLEDTAIRFGIPAARVLYKRLRYMFPVSPGLFRMMIRIEQAQLKPSVKHLRRYYEDAVREFGSSDIDLWVDYMKMEFGQPDGQQVFLHWRAQKYLDDHLTQEFITKWTLWLTGYRGP